MTQSDKMKNIKFEDWEREMMKDWRFKFWYYVYWPSYQLQWIKIKWQHYKAQSQK